jgi:hypothetical protein
MLMLAMMERQGLLIALDFDKIERGYRKTGRACAMIKPERRLVPSNSATTYFGG